MSTGSQDAANGAGVTVDERGVREIAALAQLPVQDSEIPALVRHFERMLEFVARLEEADRADAAPALHAPRAAADLRADVPTPRPMDRDRMAQNAPDWDAPFFVSPPVI
ncbi:MAG: Asp-tRNA(Asn)/Glu-tRNA(Gln) amidotransferase subunit GatC [Planctomycetota bacterium]